LTLPLTVDLGELYGAGITALAQRVELGTAFLAGAGAIGNAVVLGLSLLHTHGKLHVCDPDNVDSGNLNRCWWFHDGDLGQPKAHRLAQRAHQALPDLSLVPHANTLGDVVKAQGDHPPVTLIVGVDSRRARRSLQNEMPGRVFDASTSGIAEVVLHNNESRAPYACMACIYRETPDENAHERHVADALGVPAASVRENFVSLEAAAAIVCKYPHLNACALEGLAYDSLFKELCGQGQLRLGTSERVLAPFAFVSVLAGLMLTVEIATRLNTAAPLLHYNYWRISPWGPPVARLRERRPKRGDCEFCGNRILQSVMKTLWG
jgi:molybdopterin/thiamine biosynthesis adenylyltransferase